MTTHKVLFLPDGKEVEVEAGITLMEAAEKAEVYINSLCGGKGVCGKCKVQIKSDGVRADKHSIGFLSKEEIEKGFVLACQTKVEEDMEVMIPPESRLEGEQIMMDESVVDYSQPEKVVVSKVSVDPMTLFDPIVQKIYLELKKPTLEDNIADIERITRELRRKTEYQYFDVSLHCLQGLAAKLRENDWKITATISKRANICRILQIEPGNTSEKHYGVAVDVGTTTVVAQLVNLRSGDVMGVAGSHNLQAHYGEDVISRIIYACGREKGLNPLHEAVIKNINNLIKTLVDENGIEVEDITAVVAAGNTTMSHLLLALTPCSIRLDPYVPTAKNFPQISAREVGININQDGVLETVPGVASYVGGDIVAGVLSCGIADRPETRALIDVGTNGEIALGNNEWLVCCSASAGPAFEGGGIRCGMRATRGAIEQIAIENNEVKYKTIGAAKPRGICGSGLIDCIYELAKNRIIDGDGKFNMEATQERLVEYEGEPGFIVAFAEQTETGQDLIIGESDISNLIRSKGAVFAAIKSLIDYVGLQFDDIESFYVAGGFGNYLNIPRAIGIGLLPDIDPDRIKFVGNSSLMGARMALLSGHALEKTTHIANAMTNIELSTYQPFMDEYVAAMFLPHTDRRLFPSVDY
ncbi:MAG: DUF4445 domain-containing protein [Deltaproteobacteria bacterium]|nr:DUF4445 domain-containing protein [Deltaproteobacteria bacterium]